MMWISLAASVALHYFHSTTCQKWQLRISSCTEYHGSFFQDWICTKGL